MTTNTECAIDADRERARQAIALMAQFNISIRDMAVHMSMSHKGLMDLLRRATCTPKRHAQLLDCGFPEHLIPRPARIRRHKGFKGEPDFAGFKAHAQTIH